MRLWRATPDLVVLLGAGLLTGLVWLADWATGWEISFSLFYIGPIALATWRFGRTFGVGFALASAGAWLVADRLSDAVYSHPYIPIWNMSVRLGFFLLFAWLLSALRRELRLEKELARTDALTGLANRRHFFELVATEIARVRRYHHPFSLVYLDLDGFKQVNDRLGHPVGDAVLKSTAESLRNTLRRPDVAGRVGGDEFGILLPETDETQLGEVIERLQATFSEAMERQGWAVTLSGGGAVFHDSPRRLETAVDVADRLLYDAKRGGKGEVRIEAWRRGSGDEPSSAEHPPRP